MDIWERAAKALAANDDSNNGRVEREAARLVVRALELAPGAQRGEVLSRLILDIHGFSPEPLYEVPEEKGFATAIFISTSYFDRSDAIHAARVVARLNDIETWEAFLESPRALTRFQCIVPVDPAVAVSGLAQSGADLRPVAVEPAVA